ncbi:PQQ-binding-like beta-propeller repeat protein [Paenibacillus glucanolyticus]|uniref:PQQ-binding-like beta-propeller repeat protein n=1 Tax=Paenibacillus glucanolyticus TaxID=59843 RepID=UPI0030C9C277
MRIKKSLTVLTAFTLLFSFMTSNVNAASTPFSQGAGYHQGAYDKEAMQPISFNWDRNSRYAGAAKNLYIKWTYQTESPGLSGIILDKEGNIFVTSRGSSPKNSLNSLNPDGSLKWVYTSNENMVYTSPVIDQNSNLIIQDGKYLKSINAQTGVSQDINQNPINGQFFSEPVLDNNGTIYIISPQPSLTAYNIDGSIKWNTPLAGLQKQSHISLSNDGTLYLKNTVSGVTRLYAFDSISGNKKWEYSIDADIQSNSAPAIDINGNVYIADKFGKIYSLDKDGVLKWSFETEKLTSSLATKLVEPVIGKDGTIYASNGYKNLYAINPDGSLKWTFSTSSAITSSPIIDVNNNIYLNADNKLIIIDQNANQLGSIVIDSNFVAAMAIAADGTIYTGNGAGKIFAIGGEVTGPTDPTEPPVEPKPPVDPVGERAIFVLTLSNGTEKEYDLSMQEVQQFISWYEARAAGNGPVTFAINKHNNNKGPFKQRQDYIVYDKIITFEVNEY